MNRDTTETVLLDAAAADALAGYCRSALPEEACGLLLGISPSAPGDPLRITGIRPLRNAASDPCRRFEFAPEDWTNAVLSSSGDPNGWIGIFHSHPEGPELPSAEDLTLEWSFPVCLILAYPHKKEPSIRCYRSRPGGDWREQKVMIHNG